MTSLSFSLHASYSRSSVACFSTCWRFQNPSSATTFSSSRASAAAARSFSSHASSFLMSSMCSSEFSLSTLPFSRFITSILDDQASSSWVCLVARIFSERYEFVASTRSSTSCGSGEGGVRDGARERANAGVGRGTRSRVSAMIARVFAVVRRLVASLLARRPEIQISAGVAPAIFRGQPRQPRRRGAHLLSQGCGLGVQLAIVAQRLELALKQREALLVHRGERRDARRSLDGECLASSERVSTTTRTSVQIIRQRPPA